jgi:hypothetical protein
MLHLCASEYCIEIDITDPGWCRCWLTKGEEIIFLGAESLKYVRDHLLSGLDNNSKKTAGNLLGYDVRWVLSLAEAHHVLYTAMDNEDRILLWQDKNANVICLIRVSQTQYLQWHNKLEELT